MRHRIKTEKFSRPRAQRRALISSLLRNIFIYERIVTSEAKAKKIRRWVDKLITLAKKNTLSNHRLCYKFLKDHRLVKILFDKIAPRFNDINSGYTRIIDLGYRKGDACKMAILELVRTEKKEKKYTQKKHSEKQEFKETAGEKKISPKESEKRKGLMWGVKRIFKKERDAL
ncbi:MAG: 50S ribosomal protein L17 [Candidatus Omnitrophica bacterium]|nr:50S ribosomal protein L17 [Candidatus Omnitrophota bacterium]MCM8831969.1 50S ribosomal protein L17 [Candidatus Omnitrophota bacterium]